MRQSINILPEMQFKSHHEKRKFKPYRHDRAAKPKIKLIPNLTVKTREPKSVKQSHSMERANSGRDCPGRRSAPSIQALRGKVRSPLGLPFKNENLHARTVSLQDLLVKNSVSSPLGFNVKSTTNGSSNKLNLKVIEEQMHDYDKAPQSDPYSARNQYKLTTRSTEGQKKVNGQIGRMFNPVMPFFTSKKVHKMPKKNKVTPVKPNKLNTLLSSQKSQFQSKRTLPTKIVRNTEGIRPECKIKGDESMPPSIWSETPSKSRPHSSVVTESHSDADEAVDETMLELSIDEHTQSRPQKLPVPIMSTKASSIIVQRKADQLEILRSQLYLNKELIERESFSPSLSQKQHFGLLSERNSNNGSFPANLGATQTFMSRNNQKKNAVAVKKFIDKTIIEEEHTKYSLFESRDEFIYERQMLDQIELQRGK